MAHSMPRITIWHYPGCSTCRKAIAWLDEHDIRAIRRNIVDTPPTVDQLRGILERTGLPVEKLFNTSGQSYRNGNFKERLPQMTLEEKLQALAADGKLIRRPLLDAGTIAFAGFRPDDWGQLRGDD